MSEQEESNSMSFFGHLEEMRWRLVKSAIAIVLFTIVAFVMKDFLFNTILFAPRYPDFFTYEFFRSISTFFGFGDDLFSDKLEFSVQVIDVTGAFSAHLYVSLVAGVICAFPFVFSQVWSFVKPGLKIEEQKAAGGLIFYSSVLFLLGILFGYYIVAPLSVHFFGNYEIPGMDARNFRLDSYISIVATTTFLSGIMFLLPIVIYILSRIGIVTPEVLKKYRKHALVSILILSAIITPPDIVSQVIVSIPILLLYEVGIMVSRRVQKNNKD